MRGVRGARAAARAAPEVGGDHALLLDAVREAGALAMSYFGRDFDIWEKSPGHPVCDADLAVNDLLERALRVPRPAHGWLSEESDDDPSRLDAERVWIIDPIDGTRAFLAGRPEFTVCAALAVAGAPAAAAVFNPATGELFDALAGGGARLNGRRIRASGARTLAGARLLVGSTEMHRAGWPAELAEANVTAISSMAYKLALVAAGRFDAAVTLWPKSEWDVVAGDLLVREAGGRLTDAAGRGLEYNLARPRFGSVVAAASRLHPCLIERLSPLIGRSANLGQT